MPLRLVTLTQRWPVRVCAGQQSAEEELLLRAANLTLQAPAQPAAAVPVCCRRDHGVFLSDAYIQLMTPHVRAMLAGPVSPSPQDSAFPAASSISADAVEIVKVVSFFSSRLLRLPLSLHVSAPNLPLTSNSHHLKHRFSCPCLQSLSRVQLRPKALKCVARCCTTRAAGKLGGTHVLCRMTVRVVSLATVLALKRFTAVASAFM